MINVDFLVFFYFEISLCTRFYYFQIALIVSMVLHMFNVVLRGIERILRPLEKKKHLKKCLTMHFMP